MYLLGAALGPYATGWISDHLAERAAVANDWPLDSALARAVGLHHAMYLVPALSALLVLVMFAASRTVQRDHEQLQKWMEERPETDPQPLIADKIGNPLPATPVEAITRPHGKAK
jgi:MFS family permease